MTRARGSVLLVVALPTIGACSARLCANEIGSRVGSPDGRHEAIVFTRNCWATTGFSTQVSVATPGAQLGNEPGNVFVSRDSAVVEIEWRGPDTLLVRHAAADVALVTPSRDGVTVQFATLR